MILHQPFGIAHYKLFSFCYSLFQECSCSCSRWVFNWQSGQSKWVSGWIWTVSIKKNLRWVGWSVSLGLFFQREGAPDYRSCSWTPFSWTFVIAISIIIFVLNNKRHWLIIICFPELLWVDTFFNYNTFSWSCCFLFIVGTLLFSFLCLAGTSLFAAGLYCKGNPSMMFLLFLLGRLLLGLVL